MELATTNPSQTNYYPRYIIIRVRNEILMKIILTLIIIIVNNQRSTNMNKEQHDTHALP